MTSPSKIFFCNTNWPTNGELGLLLIKIVDIVGENNLEDLDINTVNLLVSTMNELKNVDLRNEILIEVLPLKV